jgi:glycosyltransferase involved in cell wall biosynthesis
VRVLIDVTPLQRAPSGTAVYLERLLPALEQAGATVLTTQRPPRERGRGGPRSYVNAAVEAAWIAEELPRRARRARADVLHHPLPAHARAAPCPQAITVHDLAFERLPACFDPRFRAVARRRHRAAAWAAAAVVTPSRATAADVEALWGVPGDRVIVAAHGPGQAPAPGRRGIAHFLYVGDDEPRKNLPRLLEAYARYREATGEGALPLVLAGRARVAAAPGVRVDPAPDLPALLARAAALVVPSLHEGFGLTALEAMHAGAPVLAARIPALVEVCGAAARYADPRDPASIATGLLELATVPPLREELRRRGLARAEAFSWDRAAAAHLTAYSLALAR